MTFFLAPELKKRRWVKAYFQKCVWIWQHKRNKSVAANLNVMATLDHDSAVDTVEFVQQMDHIFTFLIAQL